MTCGGDQPFARLVDAAAAAAACGGMHHLAPSAHWGEVLQRFHHRAFRQCASTRELIAFCTENNGFVIYRLADSPLLGPVLDGYLDWLKRQGRPLDSFAPCVAESPLVSPRILSERLGRRVSTSFLWHLCAATRLDLAGLEFRTVLEIGPGFGGLTRILKLLRPQRSFLLVDLPESLVFAQAYLSHHFASARTLFVTERQSLPRDWAEKWDFVLLPSNLLDAAQGLSVDLAVNLASLGEMTQEAATGYVRFLEQDMNVGHLYSINQYGNFPPTMAEGRGKRLLREDICRIALPVGAAWRTVQWHHLGHEGFAQTDPLMAPCLEVLLRGPGPGERDTALDTAMASALEEEAAGLPEGSSGWRRALWDAARLDPVGTGAAVLAAWGRRQGYPEYA